MRFIINFYDAEYLRERAEMPEEWVPPEPGIVDTVLLMSGTAGQVIFCYVLSTVARFVEPLHCRKCAGALNRTGRIEIG